MAPFSLYQGTRHWNIDKGVPPSPTYPVSGMYSTIQQTEPIHST